MDNMPTPKELIAGMRMTRAEQLAIMGKSKKAERYSLEGEMKILTELELAIIGEENHDMDVIMKERGKMIAKIKQKERMARIMGVVLLFSLLVILGLGIWAATLIVGNSI